MIQWKGQYGTLNGVAVATYEQIGDEINVGLLFPSCTAGVWVKNMEEATTYVFSQMAWFVFKTGIVGRRLGDQEPVLVVTGGYDRRDQGVVWERHLGNFNAHDFSVWTKEDGESFPTVIAERRQDLLIAAPRDWTGMDEACKWRALHTKQVYK